MKTEYGWEIEVDGINFYLSEYDDWFDTEEDAQEDAEEYAKNKIEDWKSEGVYDGETLEDFEIKIIIREVPEDDF